MKTLVFRGAPNEVLHEGGEVLSPGDTFEREDERALELVTYPNSSIFEADAEAADHSPSGADAGEGQSIKEQS